MERRFTMMKSLGLAMIWLAVLATARAETPPADRYAPLPLEEARAQTFAWAAKATASDSPPDSVKELWRNAEPGVPARGVHELVVRSIGAVHGGTAELVASLEPRTMPLSPPDAAGVAKELGDSFCATNFQLYAARRLAEARMYDEAHGLFASADMELAVDPASALFYKAVCEHQLLKKDEGLATIGALLERTTGAPESYTSVARLMQAELEALEPESLDEVSRMMRDVERRLGLARGGQRVQKKEDEIVARLDEMIKKIEQQMSQSSGSGSSGGSGSNRSSSPAGDSVVKGSTAPGNVDEKEVEREGGWGDLPPREREQAKAELEKAFPGNYGRLINEYFLKRARSERPGQ